MYNIPHFEDLSLQSCYIMIYMQHFNSIVIQVWDSLHDNSAVCHVMEDYNAHGSRCALHIS